MSLTISAIRSKIGIVWQSPMMFDDTIKNNMLLANPSATNEMIEAALHDRDAQSLLQMERFDTGTHEELLIKHVGYEQALNWQSGF